MGFSACGTVRLVVLCSVLAMPHVSLKAAESEKPSGSKEPTKQILIPTPADFDGDGKADLSVFDGRSWKIDFAKNGFSGWDLSLPLSDCVGGTAVPHDYDGDGKADIAVFIPDTKSWMIDYSSTGFKGWDVRYSLDQRQTDAGLSGIFGQDIATAISSATAGQICRVGPKKSGSPDSLGGFPNLSPLKPLSDPQLKTLLEVLRDAKSYVPETSKLTRFFPEYGLVLATDKGPLHVLVAPLSKELEFVFGDRRVTEDFDPVAEKVLSLLAELFTKEE